MHPTQIEILDSLRQDNSRKFNELLREVAETSDNLTYHLKQLQKNGFVNSPAKGEYVLSEKAVVYLNNNLELNHDLFPTVSCMLELRDHSGKILLMKKLKQPYLGKMHLPTFGIVSSRTLPAQIIDFLDRYRITAENTTFKCVHRARQQSQDDIYVFDNFFLVFQGRFVGFEESIEDRQFVALTTKEIEASTEMLSATQEVLDLSIGSGYTEFVYNDTSAS
jgi:hypothetical protein